MKMQYCRGSTWHSKYMEISFLVKCGPIFPLCHSSHLNWKTMILSKIAPQNFGSTLRRLALAWGGSVVAAASCSKPLQSQCHVMVQQAGSYYYTFVCTLAPAFIFLNENAPESLQTGQIADSSQSIVLFTGIQCAGKINVRAIDLSGNLESKSDSKPDNSSVQWSC